MGKEWRRITVCEEMQDVSVNRRRPRGCPRKTWDEALRNGLQVKDLTRESARDRTV